MFRFHPKLRRRIVVRCRASRRLGAEESRCSRAPAEWGDVKWGDVQWGDVQWGDVRWDDVLLRFAGATLFLLTYHASVHAVDRPLEQPRQQVPPNDADLQFFEREVRPVLIERCAKCHGPRKQESGLRVDSRDRLIMGGDTAAAVVPGDPRSSLLLQAIRHQGDVQMPPTGKLPEREIRALERWVSRGAPWPAEDGPMRSPSDDAADHWAFQPVRSPTVPRMTGDWARTPVDAFVATELSARGLVPSPPADRRTLIRRVTYALTGLPPTFREVQQFVEDPHPRAYAAVVDRLLHSPRYGEHWARHWLDVARYSDTKGYVYAREERVWTHAWTYRDWVVDSLNADMSYDRFLRLQLAADQVSDCKPSDLAAMGFLTLGRRFLGVQRDIIDDRIDVVCRGTMGLTVSCARCHDHKYDPIPTADYYSLYGVFDSCVEDQRVLGPVTGDESFATELESRQSAFRSKLAEFSQESSHRVRQRIAHYLFAQSELHKFPASGFDQIFQKSDLLPAFVRRWESYLRAAKLKQDPVFTIWHACMEFEAAGKSPGEVAVIDARPGSQAVDSTTRAAAIAALPEVNPLVAAAFSSPPRTLREVCDRYAAIFAEVDAKWLAAVEFAAKEGLPPPSQLEDPSAEALRQVLYAKESPCRVPDGPISHSETFFDSDSVTQLWKLQGEIDRWLINSPRPVSVALALVDQAVPVQPRVFRRGNPLRPGVDVPRQFLAVLSGDGRQPFQRGSGRAELAQLIVDPQNPLTSRVFVNRVWAHHFGRGLVETPSDFGLRAAPPSHPELLDWLSFQFVRSGWSLKQLHRWILLSATYRQATSGSADGMNRQATQIDPANRLLWRMNRRRLTFEELRDSLLHVSNSLDEQVGGRPTDLFKQPHPKRRTLYGLVDRQYFPNALRVFDFANPDLHVPQRLETTVPQQALFFMNHPVVLDCARALAQSLPKRDDLHLAIVRMFCAAYQRNPSQVEVREAVSLLKEVLTEVDEAGIEERSRTADAWQYGFGELSKDGRVAGFTPLPHFSGEAWQGGPQWPDKKLGWVQLTAMGGHPGNDRQHAAIRRWTSPRDATISILTRLTHEPAAGDGIRAFIVSSDAGVLLSKNVHQDTVDLNADSIGVRRGTTIDFVVDIGDELNSDQFLWKVTIEEHPPAGSPSHQISRWDSATDFRSGTTERLGAWAQLAQVLLCTNEFVFVD